MKAHPFAETYPIETAVVETMAADMRANGFDARHPIVVSGSGEVIDGRTRLAAAEIAGVEPILKRCVFVDDTAIVDYIRRANDVRRGTMTPYQAVVCTYLQKDYLCETFDRYDVRKALRIGRVADVDQAIKIHESGGELARELWSGERKAMPRPPRKVKPPPDTQRSSTPFAESLPPATAGEQRPPPEPTIEDRLGATRAKREAKEAKRQVRDLMSELAKARETAVALSALTAQPLPPVQRLELGSGLREATAVALASDWHVEELVRPAPENQHNAYCLEIAELRAQRFFAGVDWLIKHQQSAFKIRRLVLWLGGDFTTGQLHEENLETGQLTPLAAMLWCQDRIASGIQFLLEQDNGLEAIDVIGSYGNHGRSTHRMRAATGAGHNSDWLMYQTLAHMFASDERINVHADDNEHQFHQVYDFRLAFHHGHRVNYGGGVGGITIPLNKAVSQWDKGVPCNYYHVGHFHQYIDTGSVIVNGSLIGYNAYARSIKATPEVPQQAFYVLDSKRGKSSRAPIWVSDPSAEPALWARRKAA